MSVVAKFKVNEVTLFESGSKIKLSPVVGGSPENEKFFRFTPYGEINMGTVNDEVTKQFKPGKEYYITFEEAN